MTGKQTMFFATLMDVRDIIRNFEATFKDRYYLSGLLVNKDIPAYDSFLDTPNVGFTLTGSSTRLDSFLVCKTSALFSIREVPQRKGGVLFAVDQKLNPKSIELTLGGIYTEKDNVIVAGRVATVSEDSDSMELYNYLSKKIKKEFKRFGMFYVGKSAEQKMKEGWRLVQDERRSKDYDLTVLG